MKGLNPTKQVRHHPLRDATFVADRGWVVGVPVALTGFLDWLWRLSRGGRDLGYSYPRHGEDLELCAEPIHEWRHAFALRGATFKMPPPSQHQIDSPDFRPEYSRKRDARSRDVITDGGRLDKQRVRPFCLRGSRNST